jgi:SpoVK/Ycf46/Vps4 family AAA+-type ATPase
MRRWRPQGDSIPCISRGHHSGVPRQWDGVGSKQPIWVIGATNRRDRLDEAIVSRFGAAWEIGLPEAPERLEILRLEMRKLERDTEVPDFVGSLTTGLSGRGLATIARDVCTLAAERKSAVTTDMWRQIIARNVEVNTEPVEEGVIWGSLILPEATLKKLKTIAGSVRNMEFSKNRGSSR